MDFDRKSPQVSRTLVSILAYLNKNIVWLVSTRTFISKSCSPCISPLVTVLIVINVIFMFPNVLNIF